MVPLKKLKKKSNKRNKVRVKEMSMSISIMMSSAVTNFGNEIAKEVIRKCGMRYGFDVEEALREVSVSVMEKKEKKEKKSEMKKSLFPLPFSGEKSEMCCQALRQNNGLYTQCQSLKKKCRRVLQIVRNASPKERNGYS